MLDLNYPSHKNNNIGHTHNKGLDQILMYELIDDIIVFI